MLHLHKLRSDDTPFYLNGEFVDDYRWRFWFGDLIKEVDLAPEPEAVEVQRLLRGEHQGHMHRTSGQRVAAVQFTVSAPKSVSIACLVHGDGRVLAAQEQALVAMLSYAQTLPFFRIQVDKQKLQVRPGRFLAACFHRYASRSGDPHLHSHAIVFNAAPTEDGTWRAFEPSNFWHEMFLMGAIYRSRLGSLLQAQGYTVRWDDQGLFELEQVDRALVDRLSSRRDQIQEVVRKVTKRPIAELGRKGTLDFAANTAPRIDVGSFQERLKTWQSLLGLETVPKPPPQAVAEHITCGASYEAAQALHEAYGRGRRASGGCAVTDMLLGAFVASPNEFAMDSLLATLDDEVAAGQFHLWGEPKVAWDVADYPMWLQRTFEPEAEISTMASAGGGVRPRKEAIRNP